MPGNTIFLSTHILEVAEEICSDFAILHKGNILHAGPVADLTAEHRHLDEFFLSLVKSGSHA